MPATAKPPTPPSERWTPWAPDDGKAVTEEEYWREYYEQEHRYEWNDGILEAKPSMATEKQVRIYFWFILLVKCYGERYEALSLTLDDVGFPMMVPDPKKAGRIKKVIRKPDIGVILPDNPVRWKSGERTYHGIFDVCIESLSDGDKRAVERDTKVKWTEYNQGGVKEFYILDPGDKKGKKRGGFYWLDAAAGVYRKLKADSDGVIHSKVMDGFCFRLKDLDRLPTMDEMMRDPVYAYLLPETRAELAAAKEEIAAAKEESAKVREENAALRAKLAELGHDPDSE